VLDKLDSEHQIGRRISLRHLHIFLTVSQRGSMAQAAAQLGISQPAVSEVIADLEQTLGVPLFDRSTRGVKPTVYARTMMDRSAAAFDELKQGIRTLEHLADPTAGELWVGCIEWVTALVLPPILQEFMRRYPRVVVNVLRMTSPTPEFRELCERNLDLVLGRVGPDGTKDGELASEPLFDSRLVVAAGAHSHWARRRKLDLADLVDEPWVLTPRQCWIHDAVVGAFRARGLKIPNVSLMTYSMPLRMTMAASGPYITVFPGSEHSLNAFRHLVRILPIELPACPSPLAIITLKNRKLNPVAQLFIEHLRRHASGDRADIVLADQAAAGVVGDVEQPGQRRSRGLRQGNGADGGIDHRGLGDHL
jgi:DNA-binding transcriptional LysR family regulator